DVWWDIHSLCLMMKHGACIHIILLKLKGLLMFSNENEILSTSDAMPVIYASKGSSELAVKLKRTQGGIFWCSWKHPLYYNIMENKVQNYYILGELQKILSPHLLMHLGMKGKNSNSQDMDLWDSFLAPSLWDNDE
ncbi:hypothetical protein ACJX0J_018821, partial [Zea mays]